MNEFTSEYAASIAGTLSGFDRPVSGIVPQDCLPIWHGRVLWANQVPMTRFGAHVNEISGRVKEAALRCVPEAGRAVQYLQSSKADEEEIARAIASAYRGVCSVVQLDGVAVLSVFDPHTLPCCVPN